MREDRLRALRAIRFAARFDFDIDPETWQAIVESAPHLGRLSAERVKQELEKTMEQVERPGRALELWRDSGALACAPAGHRGHLTDRAAHARSSSTCDRKACQPAENAAAGRALQRAVAARSGEDGEEAPLLEPADRVDSRRRRARDSSVIARSSRRTYRPRPVSPTRNRGSGSPSQGARALRRCMRLVAARFAAQRDAEKRSPRAEAHRARCIGGSCGQPFTSRSSSAILPSAATSLRGAGVAEGPEMGWVLHRPARSSCSRIRAGTPSRSCCVWLPNC